MSLDSIFTQTYFNQLYETIKHLTIKEIRNLCISNKQINNYCQNNSLFQQLLKQKQFQEMQQRMQQYLQQYNNNVNGALWLANYNEDVEVFKELLKRDVDVRVFPDPKNPEILEIMLRDPRISFQQRKELSKLYQLVKSIEYLGLNEISQLCAVNHKINRFCQTRYITQLINKKIKQEYVSKYQTYIKLYGVERLKVLGINTPDDLKKYNEWEFEKLKDQFGDKFLISHKIYSPKDINTNFNNY